MNLLDQFVSEAVDVRQLLVLSQLQNFIQVAAQLTFKFSLVPLIQVIHISWLVLS